MELTFEQLPSAVSRLYIKLENIERLLQSSHDTPKPADEWFDLTGLCNYLPGRPAKSTIYGNISGIPHHKQNKKLFFLKSEIDAWLKNGRKKTVSEIQSEADNYLSNSSKRGVALK